MDTDARVLRFDSISKVLSAGVRLGFATGPKPLIDRMCLHTQATQLHTSGVSQMLVYSVLNSWGHEGFKKHCFSVADFYQKQGEALIQSIERNLKGKVLYQPPTAGMFIWLKLLGIEDSFQLVTQKAASENVLMVPGVAFLPQTSDEIRAHVDSCRIGDGEKPGRLLPDGKIQTPFVRAAFSTCNPDQIEEACKRFAKVFLS